MIRRVLWFVVGFLLAVDVGFSYAGTIPYKFNGLNVTREAGATYLRGTSPSEVAAAGVVVENAAIRASGSANWYAGTGALLQNGGVTFNAVVPLAATAASVAVTAVRANPAGLVTSAVAQYLLSKGLTWAGDHWATDAPQSQPIGVFTNNWLPGQTFQSVQAACDAGCAAQAGYVGQVPSRCQSTSGFSGENSGTCWGVTPRAQQGEPITSWGSSSGCPQGSTLQGGVCVGQGVSENDAWAAARVGMWPDAAMLDLVRRGVPLPTDKAVFTPASQDVPVSDPYVDPVTGKRMQDRARVTPSPSAPDQADVQMHKVEVDESGNPVNVNGQPATPEEQTDLCKQHPEASACQPLDDVPDLDIPRQDNPFSLNPVSGFGADNASCPATQHLFNKGGQSIDWSWGQFCTFSQGIRPLIISFAWLAAIAMVIAVGRRN